MREDPREDDDGAMNDTQHLDPPESPGSAGGPGHPPGAGPDDEFDPRRMRTIADMKRSSDDRIVAGVCAGAARYLNIDPVIIRIVLAVLTVAGFAGVILYIAAWILLPSDDADKSLAAEWFNLDRNEEQVRVVGLVGAGVLAVLSIVGDSSWSWWGDTAWWLLPVALIGYVFWIRPRRRREARERDVAAVPADLRRPADAPPAARTARAPKSRALLGLTASLTAIALAATLIYEETREDVPWTTYVAVALAVVAVGLLIGTFFGEGGSLIGIGVLLAIALAIGSVLPHGPIGSQTPTPPFAADVLPRYEHGVGELELDLTQVADREALLGRTIVLDTGIGETKVIVPDGLPVNVDADLTAGEISLFGLKDDGTDFSLDAGDTPSATSLTIQIDQKVGSIEVIRR